jgi:hypothetical protein
VQTFEAWRGEYLTQVAAAWILGCVFVRFLEDNALVEPPMIAGPGERTGQRYWKSSANDVPWLIYDRQLVGREANLYRFHRYSPRSSSLRFRLRSECLNRDGRLGNPREHVMI